MKNYFIVELDTTPPQLEIYAPNYTSPDIATEIIIKSNEPLLNYQDIYIIDTRGIRHDLTFWFNGKDELIGRTTLNNMDLGIVTLYCRLKDEVANTSALYSKTINLIEGNKLIVELEEMTRCLDLEERTQQINIKEQTRIVEIEVIS